MPRTMVTGGAGFLGSHLCERLLARGERVLCVDDFSTGSWRNVHDLLRHPRLEVLEHDVVEPFPWSRLEDVDRIYNLACPASPVHYQRDPRKTALTCVLGAVHVLDLARVTRARVLQASTSEVYGDPHVHPQPEEYWGNVNPLGPRACYDEGKRVAETLFADHRRQFACDARIVRIFNTYGPRMRPDDGRVVSNFIVQALRGHDVTLYGEGRQTRSLCFVDDLVDGLTRAMNVPALAVPVNLGSSVEVSMRELAETVIRLTGSRSRIVCGPPVPDDPQRRQADGARARALLGWEPTVSLEAGLERTIACYTMSVVEV